MQRLLFPTGKLPKASQLPKGGPVAYPAYRKPTYQISMFSTSRVQEKKAGVPLFQYPPGVKVPIPQPIVSRELRQVLQQQAKHQKINTKYGPLSFKQLEQIGDVEYNAAVITYLVKLQQTNWNEHLYLRNVLLSNPQLGAFAESMRTLNRIHAKNVTGTKGIADVQEAEFGAMSLEQGRDITTKFIQKLIDPAISFHREVYRAHIYSVLMGKTAHVEQTRGTTRNKVRKVT